MRRTTWSLEIARSLAAAAAALAVSACEAPEPTPELSDAAIEYRSCPWCCPPWRCGMNSPSYFGTSLDHLNVYGESNETGVAIVEVLDADDNGGYWLNVDQGELVVEGGEDIISGDALTGFQIVLDNNGNPSTVRIMATGWAETQSGPPRRTYALAGHAGDGVYKNICSLFDGDPNATVATIATGERYGADHSIEELDDAWFSIACAGSAVAKMLLLNYGPQDSLGGQDAASPAQREATLRMFSADYCGTGTHYTYQDAPLMFANAGGTVGYDKDVLHPGQDDVIEAVWDSGGAVCLTAPRYADVDIVNLECAPPPCDGSELGEWTTRVGVSP